MRPIGEPIKEIKVGKKTKQYFDSKECPICAYVDENGKPQRLEIDRYSINHTEAETKRRIEDLGIILRRNDFKKHFNNHSYYLKDAKALIQEAASKFALSRVDKLAQEFIDADEVIQDIITEGGNKIKRGEMNVDSKLLLGALKEQGTRKKVGSLQQMFTELDKKRFIVGEIVEEKEEELLLEKKIDGK